MNIYNNFKEPDRKIYSAKPFWAWNGKLKKEELIRQIYIMKDMGFGGFFMHSRTGLETEYLGDEWFELINACADEAEKLNMEAYIYDEDRWPSGSAGGIATINKKYRMKFIRANLINKRDFIWNDEVISAFSAEIDKNTFTDCHRIYNNANLDDLTNRHILYFTVETMEASDNYNGNAYLDTLNREAMDVFIKTTHERYKAHCGDRLGKSIPGIFTDEPHRGSLMCGLVTNRQPFNLCPYTYTLFDDFFKKYGYRLEDRLPELFYRKNGEVFSQVKWHYTELVTQMFLDNFAAPYHDWCIENNLKVTGHILHEDNLTCQTATMGSVMRYYEYMDYPGVDVLTQYNDNYCIVKQLSSAARQLGKKFLLSELDGCTGWQMSFEDFKGIGDWQAIMGINLRCPHLSWYTMRGEAKRDYPGSILHQATWYNEYNVLEDYYARISVITANTERICDNLVISPVESVWAQIYPGWAHGMGTVSPEVAELEKTFRDTYMTLLSGHVDFDYADEDMLSRMAEIICNENDVCLKVGKAVYKRVIVSGMATMRSTTLKILKEFSEKGGLIIFAGDPPKYLDALPSIFPLELSHKCSELDLNEICSNYSDLSISSPDIFLQTYSDGENTYFMFLNIKRKDPVKNVIIKPKESILQEWEPSTGECFNVPKNAEGNIIWDFLPGQLRILTHVKNVQALPEKQVIKEERRVYAEEEFTMTTDEPNIFVLDFPSFKIGNGEWQQPKEILKVDQAIRDYFKLPYRGGEMAQPWYTASVMSVLPSKDKIYLMFNFNIDHIPRTQVSLMLEEAENFDILVNDIKIDQKPLDGFYIDSCFTRFDISSALKEGQNTLMLTADFRENYNLEAVYLLGNFGVDLEKRCLVKRPLFFKYESITKQLFPFYSGKLNYTFTFNHQLKKGEKAVLTLKPFEGCACYRIGDKVVGWEPYTFDVTEELLKDNKCTVTAVLTRRNTFGPLHLSSKYNGAYGPGHFTTGGNDFTDDYVLYDAGITEKPYIVITK